MRTFGLDVHKCFIEASLHEDGPLGRVGRVEMDHLDDLADSLGPDPRPPAHRRLERQTANGCSESGARRCTCPPRPRSAGAWVSPPRLRLGRVPQPRLALDSRSIDAEETVAALARLAAKRGAPAASLRETAIKSDTHHRATPDSHAGWTDEGVWSGQRLPSVGPRPLRSRDRRDGLPR